ncbi:hypothetical protein ACFIOY_33095 [Bradyrhizobium sp. TZ2]
MARMQISAESSVWLLQAKDFLDEARRLKPGPERNELRQTAKVLRELAKLEAASAGGSPGRGSLLVGLSGTTASESRRESLT